jgi:hypothetical protein
MTHAGNHTSLRALTFLLALAALPGCGGPGYSVLRSDARVQFEPATWHVAAAEGAALDGAAFDAGVERGLAEQAGGFSFTREAGAHPHALRFTVESAAPAAEELEATVLVAILDRGGQSVGDLRMTVRAPGGGDAAAGAIGEEVGRRVMHYVHNHELHHH